MFRASAKGAVHSGDSKAVDDIVGQAEWNFFGYAEALTLFLLIAGCRQDYSHLQTRSQSRYARALQRSRR